MIGLVLKDYYNLRSYLLKQAGLMIVIYGIVGFSMKSMSFVAPMVIMSVGMMVVSSFSVDEAGHWDSYALTLPISSEDIVRGKYLLFLGSVTVSALVAGTVAIVIDSFTFHEGVLSIVAASGASALIYLLMCSVTLPIFFKIGVEKARMWMTLCFMIPFFIITFGAQYLAAKQIPMPSAGQIKLLILAAVIVIILLCYVSYLLSLKFHKAKEF